MKKEVWQRRLDGLQCCDGCWFDACWMTTPSRRLHELPVRRSRGNRQRQSCRRPIDRCCRRPQWTAVKYSCRRREQEGVSPAGSRVDVASRRPDRRHRHWTLDRRDGPSSGRPSPLSGRGFSRHGNYILSVYTQHHDGKDCGKTAKPKPRLDF